MDTGGRTEFWLDRHVHLEGIPGRTRAKTPKLERPGVQLGQWAHGGRVALQSNHDSPDHQNIDISGTNNLGRMEILGQNTQQLA